MHLTFRITSLLLVASSTLTVSHAVRADVPIRIGLPDAVTISEETTSAIRFELQPGANSSNQLAVAARSSDQSVIPDSAILVSAMGGQRAVLLSPAKTGRTQITIAVSDGQGF